MSDEQSADEVEVMDRSDSEEEPMDERQAKTLAEHNEKAPELEERVAQTIEGMKIIDRMMEDVLEEGKDFGEVQGVPKPFLFKSGAEQLARTWWLSPEIEQVDKTIDLDREYPYVDYEYKCKLYSRVNGDFIGDGIGSANSYESKYQYDKKGNQQPDHYPMTNKNTIQKMAKKRAFVDAILTATGASRYFTQDEDVVQQSGGRGSGGSSLDNVEYDPDEEIDFGKHEGKTWDWLSVKKAGYLDWVASSKLDEYGMNENNIKACYALLSIPRKIPDETREYIEDHEGEKWADKLLDRIRDMEDNGNKKYSPEKAVQYMRGAVAAFTEDEEAADEILVIVDNTIKQQTLDQCTLDGYDDLPSEVAVPICNYLSRVKSGKEELSFTPDETLDIEFDRDKDKPADNEESAEDEDPLADLDIQKGVGETEDGEGTTDDIPF